LSDLVIYGSGGFAREVHQLVLDLVAEGAAWRVLGFLDDARERHGLEVHGLPVLGGWEWLRDHPGVAVAVGIGSPAARRHVVRRVLGLGPRAFPTLVHPRTWVGRGVTFGEGTVVCAGCLLTTDIAVGRHVILNLGCTVGHDAVIADFVTLAPSVNVSGGVTLQEGCDIGTGAAITPGVAVGPWTVVGAGAAVVRDLPANVTAVGVPARPIKHRPPGWQDREGEGESEGW